MSKFRSTQEEIYDGSVRLLVEAVLQGFNGTIFAYGQTGTGKTFTMQGVIPALRANFRMSFLMTEEDIIPLLVLASFTSSK